MMVYYMLDTKRSKRPAICLIVCHREFCEKRAEYEKHWPGFR